VTIPDGHKCAVQGLITQGGMCAHTVYAVPAYPVSTTEILDLLNAQPQDRTCVPAGQALAPDGKTVTENGIEACADDQSRGVPAVLPARGASVILSDPDYVALTTAAQEACRELGDRCSYQVQSALKALRVRP
jgi:hypothetical protein